MQQSSSPATYPAPILNFLFRDTLLLLIHLVLRYAFGTEYLVFDILYKMVVNWHLLLESKRLNEMISAKIYEFYLKKFVLTCFILTDSTITDSVLNGH